LGFEKAVNRRLVKVVNCGIVERVFWIVNSDSEEEVTERPALADGERISSRNGQMLSLGFAILHGPPPSPLHALLGEI